MFELSGDPGAIGRLLAASLPALVTILGLLRGPGAIRTRLRHDVELLEKFPPDSEARRKFEVYLSEQVDHFAKYETASKRDVQGLVIAGVLVVGFGALALWLFTLEDWWWWILAASIAIFALAGLATMYESAQKIPRDDKGKPL